LPSVPEKLIAYKVTRPVVDETYARTISKRLGFNEPMKFYTTDNSYRVYNGDPYNDDSPVFSVYQDGSMAIYYTRKSQRPTSLPTDQECIDIARKWLKSYDMYSKDIINITTSPDIVYIMMRRTESQYTLGTWVSFIIGLDGYELFGMGAFFLIGENGKILEVHVNAPEFEPYCYVKVQKSESALDMFQDYLHNLSKLLVDSPECLIINIYRYISVDNASLKYFAMLSPDGIQPVYAQPVYIFTGEGRDKPELPWEHFIGMVDAVSR
jgi:hypothetical protein